MIKILLLQAEVTQAQIAEKLGIPSENVTDTIAGRRHTRRIQEAIAQAVGREPEKLWPPA